MVEGATPSTWNILVNQPPLERNSRFSTHIRL